MSALRLSKFDGPPYAYAARCADCGTVLRAHASDTPQRAEREMRSQHSAAQCARARKEKR